MSRTVVEEDQYSLNNNSIGGDNQRRLPQPELSTVFLSGLGNTVSWHGDVRHKPLLLDLNYPAPLHLRVYLYNATFPPGGRTLGERKIQLIVPGQPRGGRGNLDHSGGRIVLLVGYESDIDVFILWDAGTYRNFPYSMNVQVNPETVFTAFAGRIAFQNRLRRTPETANEIVVCAPRERLLQAIQERNRLSLERMVGSI